MENKPERKIGLLTKEEIAQKRAILGGFAIDHFGDEVYQLPNGGLANKAGWEMFNNAVKKWVENGK